MNNTLLEGKPGIGKTTLLRTIADQITVRGIGGFYTQEIREKGHRVGFWIETFTGQSRILAHVDYTTGPRVRKYRVDVAAFEEIGVNGLKRALIESNVILIDEIGKMELFSRPFWDIMLRCLDSVKPVIATVMAHPHPFVDRLKARSDVQLVTVTLENRDKLALKLIHEINGLFPGPG